MSLGKILCCLCGVSIDPNDAAMCLDCLRVHSDVTEGIERTGELIQCRKCDRWMVRQGQWQRHKIESLSLLAVCLKKVSGLQRPDTKIVDAGWIWTEPHSMRIKMFVNIERGVLDGKVKLKQRVDVEFVVKPKQCLECIREATDHSFGALIQVRQHVGHKRSFFHLEALLVKANLYNLMLSIEVVREGIDFYFKSKAQADKVVEFIQCNMPTKTKLSKKLVSRDLQSNTSKHEYTIHMEVIPLCKGDLVITSKDMTGKQELMLVTKLTASIHLLNPCTLNRYELSGTKYFAKPLPAFMNTRQLITYVVLDVKILTDEGRFVSPEDMATLKLKSIRECGGLLAEVVVAKESDLGENDLSYVTVTHLGHVLQTGDNVLGYDVAHSVHNAENDTTVSNLSFDLPDVILVRKSYPESTKIRKRKKNKPSWMKNKVPNAVTPIEEALVSPTPAPTTEEAPAVENVKAKSTRRSKKATGNGNADDAEDLERKAFKQEILDETAFEEEELRLMAENRQRNKGVGTAGKTAPAATGVGKLSATELALLESGLNQPVLEGDDTELLPEEYRQEYGDDDDEDEGSSEDDHSDDDEEDGAAEAEEQEQEQGGHYEEWVSDNDDDEVIVERVEGK